MVDFGKNSQKIKPDSSSKPRNDPQASTSSDIATAEYSFFHIHQIKAWAGWSVDQEEIDYTVDPPAYLLLIP
jgi:hypothetical protein